MKKLVVFYSLEGNTKLIAESIAEAVGADILELKPKKELNPKSLMKYFWGGKEAIMNKKPELLPLDKNPNEYDLLFVGTPVWAWTYSSPANTFLSTHSLTNKKVALFCCSGGAKGKTLDKMKKAFGSSEILGEIDFRKPLKHSRNLNVQKAKEWAKAITEASA